MTFTNQQDVHILFRISLIQKNKAISKRRTFCRTIAIKNMTGSVYCWCLA